MMELERITGKTNFREAVAKEWQAIAPRIIEQAKRESSRKAVEVVLSNANIEGEH